MAGNSQLVLKALGSLVSSKAYARVPSGSGDLNNPPPLTHEEVFENDLVEAERLVVKLHTLVEGWKKKHVDKLGWELEFRARDWKEVEREIGNSGNFDLVSDFGNSHIALEGLVRSIANSSYKSYGDRVHWVVENYNDDIGWLSQYEEIECEDWWMLWRGNCPDRDEIKIVNYTQKVRIDTWGASPSFGGGCFPGDAFLQMKNGGLITFDQIREMESEGVPLPQIASFDDASGEVVYQTPIKVVEHIGIHSTLLYLNVQSLADEAVTLKVTDNHNMLVEREGAMEWIAAGEVQVGDLLVGPEGDRYFYSDMRQVEEGAHDVFNLSFSAETTGQVPTYLVSPDGGHWFVAHNLK